MVYQHRYLIVQMTKREIAGRYRGSVLGFAWSFLNPLLMLVVYTFVFSVVFKARWDVTAMEESRVDFALTLFSGLIIFNLFAEIVNRAPGLILSNVNYVKKVIFPLEILPLVSIGGVSFHALVSLLVLIAAQLLLKGAVPWSVIYIPVIVLPLLIASAGISWFLAALTVYIRDVAHITSVFTTVLMFLSAVFFPISALPEKYQLYLRLNPIAAIVNESRNAIIFGVPPDWMLLGIALLLGLVLVVAGYIWFQKARKGFADVL
jgi:lipopolysaccharide transport system permease protein